MDRTDPRQTPTVSTAPTVPGSAGRCRQQCPADHRCGLDANVPHTLHICPDAQCWCHSRQRYEAVR